MFLGFMELGQNLKQNLKFKKLLSSKKILDIVKIIGEKEFIRHVYSVQFFR